VETGSRHFMLTDRSSSRAWRGGGGSFGTTSRDVKLTGISRYHKGGYQSHSFNIRHESRGELEGNPQRLQGVV
jgi:hypothetical protein